MIGTVFATDENGGFGFQGKIPWHVPEDYAHFKRVTLGGKIVMGKDTFLSLPKLLPNREHIVVSTTLSPGTGYKVYTSPEEVLKNEGNNFWVIGGPGLIMAFHELVGYDIAYYSMIYSVHEVDVTFPNHDTIFKDMNITGDQVHNGFEITKFAHNTKF